MARHHLFVADRRELVKCLEATVGDFIDLVTLVENPSERLTDYSEMALGGAERPWVAGYTKETYKTLREQPVDVRKGILAIEGISDRLQRPLGEYMQTRPAAQLNWLLHAYLLAGARWLAEVACGMPTEALVALQNGVATAFPPPKSDRVAAAVFRLTGEAPEELSRQEFPYPPSEESGTAMRVLAAELPEVVDALLQIDPAVSVFPMPDDPQNVAATPKVRDLLQKIRAACSAGFAEPLLVGFRR